MSEDKWWSSEPEDEDAIPLGPFAVRYAILLMVECEALNMTKAEAEKQIDATLRTIYQSARSKRGSNTPKEHPGGAKNAGGTPAGQAPT